MTTTKKNTRLYILLIIAGVILLIPLVAMNFSSQVRWDLIDFVVAAAMLLGTVLAIEIIWRKIRSRNHRVLLGAVVFLALLLIWLEMAVGLFGTVIAGS